MASLTDNALTRYIKESREELRKVTWPSRRTIVQHTLIVVGVTVVLAAAFTALDYGLADGIRRLLDLKKSA
jgi:preprotein translocase subunit SecE